MSSWIAQLLEAYLKFKNNVVVFSVIVSVGAKIKNKIISNCSDCVSGRTNRLKKIKNVKIILAVLAHNFLFFS